MFAFWKTPSCFERRVKVCFSQHKKKSASAAEKLHTTPCSAFHEFYWFHRLFECAITVGNGLKYEFLQKATIGYSHSCSNKTCLFEVWWKICDCWEMTQQIGSQPFSLQYMSDKSYLWKSPNCPSWQAILNKPAPTGRVIIKSKKVFCLCCSYQPIIQALICGLQQEVREDLSKAKEVLFQTVVTRTDVPAGRIPFYTCPGKVVGIVSCNIWIQFQQISTEWPCWHQLA